MKEKKGLLNRIARYMMLYTSFTSDLGLLTGKMGVCIFFYRYSIFTEKKYYSDFAGELIDEIYNEIHIDYSKSFNRGLAGIAWGIEYLIQNKFVDAVADEILENLDMQMLERDVRQIRDTSLDTGLEGVAHYVLSRCTTGDSHNIAKSYIIDLAQSLADRKKASPLIAPLISLSEGITVEYEFNLLNQISIKSKFRDGSLSNYRLGVYGNGLTGIAINLLNRLE